MWVKIGVKKRQARNYRQSIAVDLAKKLQKAYKKYISKFII